MADKSKDEAFTQQTGSTQEEPKPVWPPNEEFPLNIAKNLNISGERTTVLQEVVRDSNCSENYLVVTGYTSLGHIVDFFSSKVDFSKMVSVCIVFGFDPEIRRRKSWGRVNFEKEIKDYWLERGYSLFKGGNVIRMIDLIKANKVQFKILDQLHAKIYVGDSYAILGSSNFSKNGLTQRLEANVRVTALATDSFKQQYEHIASIAENYYKLARGYKEDIIDLLEKLIDVTSWQEALARAIAEILECSWFKEFPELYEKLNNINLWPIQRHGLGQAIYTLQTQGCVLVADPTGSGKTKLISTLQILLFHWLWKSGRKNKSNILIICPPVVQSNWFRESLDVGFAQNHLISMGLLSHSYNSKFKDIEKAIKAANVLVLDEAHNYLNLSSNRSETIARHTVDYIILVTATPISRKPGDLLRLIELLDVDNLDDAEIQQLNKLKKLRFLKDTKQITA